MKVPKVLLVLFCTSIALLCACAGQQRPAGPFSLPPTEFIRADLNVKQEDLLYVANSNAEVTVYRYWKHTLLAVLTDFRQPMGECSDRGSNVYITDYAAKKILEFTHGGTKPIKSFDDAPHSPYACYIDPTTGDLTVANNDGNSKTGNIAIWTVGSSKPRFLTDPQIPNFLYCAYDDRGDLLATNGNSGYSNPTLFAWLPKGGSELINIKVPGPSPTWTWYYVTGMQWDGKFFVLDDYNLYRILLLHGQAYYASETQLYSGGYGQYWIYENTPGSQGTQAVGPSYNDSNGFVSFWSYPVGGQPVFDLMHGLDKPVAVTVSYKAK